ncbi:MAG: ATP-binding protein [Thermoguttaceae bacterium]
MFLTINYYTWYGTLYWNIDILSVCLFGIIGLIFLSIFARTSPFQRAVSIRRTLVLTWSCVLVTLVVGTITTLMVSRAAVTYWNFTRLDRARAFAAALDAMHHDQLEPVPETANTELYKDIHSLILRWQNEIKAVLNICTFHKTDDGRYVFIMSNEADYNGDGKLEGPMEEHVPPGTDFYFENRPKSFITDAIDYNRPSTTDFPFYNFGRYWTSVVIPLHLKDGKADSALMVDYYGDQWLASVAQSRKPPVFTTAIIIILMLGAALVYILQLNYIEKEKLLAELKNRFFASMSHEIRTPMNAIVTMSELLMDEKLSDKQHAYVSDMKQSADSLLTIVNDLLDFSKLEAGKMELVPKNYRLNDLLKNIENTLGCVAERKEISFDVIRSDAVPEVLYGDDIRLKQVLWNIIGNAIKFTSTGGVTLTVQANDTSLMFIVADTGLGIKEEDIPKLFDVFTQVDHQNTSSVIGTGLGLSICKSIIELMHGTIEISSVYGKGSEFAVSIPKVLGDPEKITAPKVSEKKFITESTAKVLVTDDNEINLNAATGVFGAFGITIDTAKSGPEAIEKIKSSLDDNDMYDIVFMDHMMPGMNGLDATELIRTLAPACEKLPIIALTANAIHGAKEMFLTSGMNGFVAKPIDRSELNSVLIEWLPKNKYTLGTRPHAEKTVGVKNGMAAEADESRLIFVQGLDAESGLERNGGNCETYVSSLRMFNRNISKYCEQLLGNLASCDMPAYQVEVHGVKGVLKNIGCDELAKIAAELENAAGKLDVEYCKKFTNDFISRIERLNVALSAALFDLDAKAQKASTAQKPAGNAETLQKNLALINSAVNDFDTDTATALIDELLEYDYGQETLNTLSKIKLFLEEFNYKEARVHIKQLSE